MAAGAVVFVATAILTASASARMPAWADAPHPGGRPPSVAEIDLGRQLFYDPRLSSNGHVSCATCHQPERGFADGEPLSASGVSGARLKRHTPHLFNLAWSRTFFWDGRSTSLESQALEPIRNPDEMGLPGNAAAARLQEIPAYGERFSRIYRDSGVTMKNIGRALAAFERTLVATDAPFDRFEAGDRAAMPERAVRGRQLFFGRAKCSTCHSGPHFTDGQFHNTGVISDDPGRAAFDRVGEFQMRPYPFFQMRQAFKTPSLRNVALTAPYQHNGSEPTLAAVVRFYNQGGRDDRSYGKALDIRPLHLSEPELDDLVAFLGALTSPVVVQRPVAVPAAAPAAP
jgi:cytochrome c peroxidase